ncbi:hypothetical protein [Flavobacterium nackdongense]|uniref:SGNH/GDSL hydrolase family protein n=1 Tax=Flavobacterium nackdongense TaxID=2547394 RepID=A0A4P6YG24_9FLAO|nr:hypothetical protein [Flavobacterium nackdongense]QBN19874.1 hypothetical protein E1750_14035 [Flavobacterium nackdongense]
MKKFIKYCVGGFLAILLLMLVLDIVYTKIYETSYPRSKFQYFRSLKNKKVDYIFIGSPRVENGIVPSIIQDKTGKTAANLGWQAAKLGDIYTVLQLIKEYNIHYDKILIQVDYIYNMVEGHSNIFEYEMMPFVRENNITREYLNRFVENSDANYYIPFYRYCNNDLKLGFREIFANSIHKKNNVATHKGYVALHGNSLKLEGALPKEILNKNAILDSIQSFIKQNKMEVFFYCAPFCKNNQNTEFTTELAKKIPGFRDFSGVIADDRMFQNCNHLNDNGAKRFTEIITEEVLMKNNEKH